MFEQIIDGVSRVDPIAVALAGLAGVGFAFFYRSAFVGASWRRHLWVGMLVFLTFITFFNVQRVVQTIHGRFELDELALHTASPSLRWWSFILAGCVTIAILERVEMWRIRRKHDRLSQRTD